MEPWVAVTLMAASAQAVRFMLQKHLKSTKLSTAGAMIAVVYAQTTGQGAPDIPASFWPSAIAGGLSQILATMCVVAIFAHRNFAVGITFKKTEVILAAIVGLVVLGDVVTLPVLGAIIIVLSGLLFAFSGVGYRGASLSLGEGDVFYRAIVTLAFVTAFQVVVMAIWLALRERAEIARVLAAWRVAGLVGITSMIGSIGWFTAFTMQTVALVKAVGQVELILSLLATMLVFGEAISKREWQGLVLIAASVLLLIFVA